MPDAPARGCVHPGCPEYASARGRCEQHARAFDAARGTTKERGYDGAWRKFRAWFLRRHPVCEDCGHAATEVHHKVKIRDRLALRLVESNCMALCHACHAMRTARGE